MCLLSKESSFWEEKYFKTVIFQKYEWNEIFTAVLFLVGPAYLILKISMLAVED